MATQTQTQTQLKFQTLPMVKSTAQSAEQLLSELESTNTMPLWTQMAKLNPPVPNPKCVPHIWRYEQIRPSLLRAGDLITEKQAERRVLMLVNPARGVSPAFLDFFGSRMLTITTRSALYHRYSLRWPSIGHAK